MIAQSDKEELFDRILAENEKRFFFMASNYASRDDVMDLYQEMASQIWKGLGSYQSRSSPDTWAYRVALITAIKFRRNNWRRLRAWRQYSRDMGGLRRKDADPRGGQEILEEFLQRLDKDDRGVFMLYLSDMPYGEMAAIAGISETSLRVKIRRIQSKFYERYIGK